MDQKTIYLLSGPCGAGSSYRRALPSSQHTATHGTPWLRCYQPRFSRMPGWSRQPKLLVGNRHYAPRSATLRQAPRWVAAAQSPGRARLGGGWFRLGCRSRR